MTTEIPTQEQSATSPEHQAVIDLSATLEAALDGQRVAPQMLDDGGQLRKVQVNPPFGSSLAETTAPDGTKSYEYSSIFVQSHDRGLMTWSWKAGDNTVAYHGNMEVGGVTDKSIEDVAGIGFVKSNVEYVASQLPEQAKERKGRLGRLLGRFATGRR